MINSEEDVLNLAKKFGLVSENGRISERYCPDTDKFPELLGKYGDEETFIKKWVRYAASYNRKLKNKERALKNQHVFREDIRKRVEREKKKNTKTYSNPNKKGGIPRRTSNGKFIGSINGSYGKQH